MAGSEGRAVPLCIQDGDGGCGPSALWMICCYYGKRVSLSAVKAQCAQTPRGTSAKELVSAARHFGFVSEVYDAPGEALFDVDLPAIVHYRSQHFVVVESVAVNGICSVLDPERGHVTMTTDALNAIRSGVVITVSPVSDGCAATK